MSEFDDIIGSGDVPLVHDARPWFDLSALVSPLGLFVAAAAAIYIYKLISDRMSVAHQRKYVLLCLAFGGVAWR